MSTGLGRRERNRLEKLKRITDAARDLFRSKGYEATTARQICERADIGTGTLFLYVKEKRELLAIIFQPLAEGCLVRITRDLGENESVVDGLYRIFRALSGLYGKDPEMARLFVQDLLFRSNRGPKMEALNDDLQSRVEEMVATAQRRGDLRDDVSVKNLSGAFFAHYVLWLQIWLGHGTMTERAACRGLRSALQLQFDGAAEKGKKS